MKVNGKRIIAPFSLQNGGKIEKENDTIMVDVNIGLKVFWNGRGFLEVFVSPIYKGKLCGLCGNYNSVASDDLMTRNRKSLTDSEVWKFANSWKVGGKKACRRLNEQYKKPQCKNKNIKHYCRPLKLGKFFGDCDTKLSPTNYYEACLQDMCECPNFQCYCESFAAYARECLRLGANIPNWRHNTKCSTKQKRRNNLHEIMLDSKQSNLASTNRQFYNLPQLARLKPRPRTSLPDRLPIQ